MEKSFVAIELAQCAPHLMGKTEKIVRALGVKSPKTRWGCILLEFVCKK